MNQDFRFGTEALANTGGTAADATEGSTLISQIESAGGNGQVLIGHSNGGLVARYAAQYFQNNNQLSVTPFLATIDTPHSGANITASAPVVVAGIGGALVADCLFFDASGGCLTGYLMIAGGAAAAGILTNAGGALGDMSPGSYFLQNLNSGTETFGRAGIIGHAPRRWSFVRYFTQSLIGANWKNSVYGPYPETTEPCNPEDSCGERAAAQTAEVTYDSLVVAAVVDAFIGIFYPPALALEPFLLESIFWMDAADAVWNLFVDFPGDGTSDALVSGSSQSYPGSGAVNYVIENADSHSGALRSQYDHAVLDTILANQFHVPMQSSCGYSLSSSADTVSGQSQTGYVSVSSSSGCLWTASTQNPWIQISSAINGNTNGTIDFAIQANPLSTPRMGSIQIGNGFSFGTLNITQLGACTFTLSESEFAVPPTGGSGSVTVSTQPDCTWSAVPSSPWISVTSGMTGTGYGTFTWSAMPTAIDADQTGTITVAGQTIIIDAGSTSGHAADASVTISGNDPSYTYSPCPQNYPYCSQPITIYESGYVIAIVNGETFSWWYAQGSTPQSVANGLASAMNYPDSPIVATVTGSGSTYVINITSSILGAATDYSLSATSNFNSSCVTSGTGVQYCFYSPAFTAQASGNTLIGGTN